MKRFTTQPGGAKKSVAILSAALFTVSMFAPIDAFAQSPVQTIGETQQLEISDYKFQKPTAPYIVAKGEAIKAIEFAGGSAAELQNIIDDARKADPTAVIIAEISGKVIVSKDPLLLGENINLIFKGNGGVECDEDASGITSLVHIHRAKNLSISSTNRAVFDGKDIVEDVIKISNSCIVNIDNIVVENAKFYGITFNGNGEGPLNEASSLTRCTIQNNGIGGLDLRNSARFMAFDNIFEDNATYGMVVTSQSTLITGNTVKGSKTAMRVSGPRCLVEGPGAVIARNTIESNGVGLMLGQYAKRHLVTENTIKGNDKGMVVMGERNHIYNNTMDNATEFENKGDFNVICRNEGVLASDIDVQAITSYFNPPTANNPHKDQTIVLGMGRKDIEVTQAAGAPAVNLKDVQELLDKTRAKNKTKFVVLWLKGNFVANQEYTGLSIPENCSVVLDGVIYAEGDGMDQNSKLDHYSKSTTSGGTQLVLMKEKGFVSFSGGELDAKDLSAYGIYAPGNNVCVIDGVKFKSAVANQIGTLHHYGDKTPVFISGCDFNGYGKTNRGVWTHICDFVHCISNTSQSHFADYVDLDAEAYNCTVLYGTAFNERRCGVFIEENASSNVVLGNTFTGDIGNGISLYSSFNHTVRNNILVGNTFNGTMGMNVRHGRNTLVFNNIINPRKGGRYGVYLNVEDNLTSQNCHLGEANLNMENVEQNSFFCAPVSIESALSTNAK